MGADGAGRVDLNSKSRQGVWMSFDEVWARKRWDRDARNPEFWGKRDVGGRYLSAMRGGNVRLGLTPVDVDQSRMRTLLTKSQNSTKELAE